MTFSRRLAMLKIFTRRHILALACLLAVLSEQSVSQNIYLPQKVKEYLRINELMGVKPSSVFDLFPELNKGNRAAVVHQGSHLSIMQEYSTAIHTDTIIATAYGSGTI